MFYFGDAYKPENDNIWIIFMCGILLSLRNITTSNQGGRIETYEFRGGGSVQAFGNRI